jgi:uncharacterized membrane protein YdfJ with MMPL/SSD domain
MFIFLLALGEDYNILVMSRIREEAHHLPLRDAVVRAIEVTGTTVTSAGMVLGGTFLVFAIAGATGSEGAQIREIGIGLTIGVALDTFVVRTLIVPSVVVLLGRYARHAAPRARHAGPRACQAGPRADHAGRAAGHAGRGAGRAGRRVAGRLSGGATSGRRWSSPARRKS